MVKIKPVLKNAHEKRTIVARKRECHPPNVAHWATAKEVEFDPETKLKVLPFLNKRAILIPEPSLIKRTDT